MSKPINVIEVRRAKNGYVVSAFMSDRMFGPAACAGYATYVIESESPAEVGRVVAKAIEDHAITSDVIIPPAREVP